MAVQYFPSRGPAVCAPVPLSPEVKAYIDQKLAANAGNAQCGDVPAILARVNEIESKMGSLDKYEELRTAVAEKREGMNLAIANARQKQTDILANLRNAELSRLRNQVAMMCSGISIRSSVPADAADRLGGGNGQGQRGGRKNGGRGNRGNNPGGGQGGGGGQGAGADQDDGPSGGGGGNGPAGGADNASGAGQQ
jgi:hypothetical protein